MRTCVFSMFEGCQALTFHMPYHFSRQEGRTSLAGLLAQLGTLPSGEAPAWEAAKSWVLWQPVATFLVPEFLPLRGLESGSLLTLGDTKPQSMLEPGPGAPRFCSDVATREPGTPAGTARTGFVDGRLKDLPKPRALSLFKALPKPLH